MPLLRWFMSPLKLLCILLTICGDLLLSATHRFIDRKHSNNCLIGAPLKWTWLHHILFVNQHALLCSLVKHNRVNNRKFRKVCVLEHSSTKNTNSIFHFKVHCQSVENFSFHFLLLHRSWWTVHSCHRL